MLLLLRLCFFFFFNDTATTEIYTLSLHDALPIWCCSPPSCCWAAAVARWSPSSRSSPAIRWSTSVPMCSDRKSTRLNSSHSQISYAVFCLKKKKQQLQDGHSRHQLSLLAATCLHD